MDTMEGYYHATKAVLRIGENAGSKAYDYSNDTERQRLEDFLESKRPEEVCSRLTSWFACDTAANSAKYMDAERNRSRNPEDTVHPNLYAIELDRFSKQPMILVNAVDDALRQNDTVTAEMLATGQCCNPET